MTTQPTKADMDLIRALIRLEAKRIAQEGGATAYEAALDRADDARREQKERGAL